MFIGKWYYRTDNGDIESDIIVEGDTEQEVLSKLTVDIFEYATKNDCWYFMYHLVIAELLDRDIEVIRYRCCFKFI